jgi:hypothetical protein
VYGLISIWLLRRRFALWFPCRNRDFGGNDFRTVGIGIYGSHHGNFQFLCDCAPTQTFLFSKPHDFVSPEHSFGPAQNFVVRLRRSDSCKRSFANHLALEFHDRGENLKQKPTGWVFSVRIQPLTDSDESNPVAIKRRDVLIQVQHAPAEAVGFVDHDDIELPALRPSSIGPVPVCWLWPR